MNPEKTAFVKQADYSSGIRDSVEQLIELLGGMDTLFAKNSKILIKPNMLTDRTPDQAVTTHPELVRAIIRIIREHGSNPVVADSPASVVKLETVWEKTGYRQLCEEENVPLINLEASGSVAFERNGFKFNIAKPVLDADAVINVPKVKTHNYTVLTCAMKNLFGTVPGYQKTHLHKTYPHPRDFGKVIVEINKVIKPILNIADGVIGMDGNGPSAGKPAPLGFLAASRDARSLDLALCRILKIKQSKVSYLGSDKTNNDIEIVGDPVPEIRNFRLPVTFATHLIPGKLASLLGRFIWIRPSISEACVSCGRCAAACPAKALTMKKGQRPMLDRKKCIGCCCCHEICPQKAISMQMSPILRLFSGRSLSSHPADKM